VNAFGAKVDAVPGRLNQIITTICKSGIFYGQCSELCGVAHGFMPIVVQAVSFSDFVYFYRPEVLFNYDEIFNNEDQPRIFDDLSYYFCKDSFNGIGACDVLTNFIQVSKGGEAYDFFLENNKLLINR
jgi:hypothetical protein